MAGHKKFSNQKLHARLRRKRAIRQRVEGTTDRPRLSVFRSHKHVFVQAIDDSSNKVLATATDANKAARNDLSGKKKSERAKLVGGEIGKKLLALEVKRVVFDRNGYLYHGRVKQIAEGAREAGLEF